MSETIDIEMKTETRSIGGWDAVRGREFKARFEDEKGGVYMPVMLVGELPNREGGDGFKIISYKCLFGNHEIEPSDPPPYDQSDLTDALNWMIDKTHASGASELPIHELMVESLESIKSRIEEFYAD